MESVAAKIHSNYNALNAQHHRDRQELLEHKKKKHGQPNTEKIFMQASLRLQERHEMHLQEVKKKEMETKQHFDAKFEKQRGALTEHHDKGHLMAFDTLQELEEFVQGEVILNKLGLIVKTRNGVTKARMILDTKESGVKTVTAQGQRITLPRMFDAIIPILFLLSCMAAAAGAVIDFLDISINNWIVFNIMSFDVLRNKNNFSAISGSQHVLKLERILEAGL